MHILRYQEVWKKKKNGYNQKNSLVDAFSCLQVNEVRNLIGTLPDKLSIYCSDATIRRYLTARNWNVKKATKMLKDSLKWRSEYKPEEIRWVCFWNSLAYGFGLRYFQLCTITLQEIIWFLQFHLWRRKRLLMKQKPGKFTDQIISTSMGERFWSWDLVSRFPPVSSLHIVKLLLVYSPWSYIWKSCSLTVVKPLLICPRVVLFRSISIGIASNRTGLRMWTLSLCGTHVS